MNSSKTIGQQSFQNILLNDTQNVRAYLVQAKEEIQETVSGKLNEIRESITSEKNLVRIKKELTGLKNIVKERYTAFRTLISQSLQCPDIDLEIDANQSQFFGEVDGLIASVCKGKEYDIQERWVKFELPEEVLSTHPDCVTFLMKSGLARLMVMFQNSTSQGIENHKIRFDRDSMPLIKMDGNWVRWDKIKEKIIYNETVDKVVSKDNLEEIWTYISPFGIVQKSLFNYEKAYPVEQLSQKEYEELLGHAGKFWQSNPEIDPGIEKKCIFQIVSTHREYIENTWAIKNLQSNFPRHVSVRVVDSEGRVYSFGLQMPKEEEKAVLDNMPWSFLTTAFAKMPLVDYEEPRHEFGIRRVTSLPLSEARKEALLKWVAEINKPGITFNFGKQNCTRITEEALKIAGLEVDSRMSFPTYVWNILPSLADVPFVGKPFSNILQTVSSVVRPVFQAITSYIPQPIRQAVSFVGYLPITFLEKTCEVASVLFAMSIGACSTSAAVAQMEDTGELPNDEGTPRFKQAIQHWYDVLDERMAVFYHSKVIIDWQDTQKTTVPYPCEKKPKLYIIPSQRLPDDAVRV